MSERVDNMAKANQKFREQRREERHAERMNKAREAIARAQGNLKEAVK